MTERDVRERQERRIDEYEPQAQAFIAWAEETKNDYWPTILCEPSDLRRMIRNYHRWQQQAEAPPVGAMESVS